MADGPPVILVIAGHDPTGGAGIQADIESIIACGAYPVTLISALTVQDTCNLSELHLVEASVICRQAHALLADITPAAIKVGLLGSVEMVETVGKIITDLDVPFVLDPVLGAGGGGGAADNEVVEAIKRELVPQVNLCTPNIMEAERLTGKRTPEEQAATLMTMGCENVLITGTHDDATVSVVNRLFCHGGDFEAWEWPRLSGSYHGSGCTLASSISAKLGVGASLRDAVREGQEYTWSALLNGYQLGSCQAIPARR